MPELQAAIVNVELDLMDHPAAGAWHKLGGELAKLDRIEILKEEKGHSAVYRLLGVGPNGGAVVAKRCTVETASIERLVHEKILPYLPVPSLTCYGSVESDSNENAWVFLEDAGDHQYLPNIEEHRALSCDWLGKINLAAQDVSVATSLPDRGPSFYLAELQLARKAIIARLDDAAFSAYDAATIEMLASHCTQLEARWYRLEQFCAGMPRTLVHGDLAAKNIRIQKAPVGNGLIALDWELAGWGIPAADLAQLDANPIAYFSAVHSSWRSFSLSDVQRLTALGALFRLITALMWTNWGFHADSLGWYMDQIRWLEPGLAKWVPLLDQPDLASS